MASQIGDIINVYELVDHTDEDVYFTIGLFSSQKLAEDYIARFDGPQDTGNGGPVNNESGADYFADEPEILNVYVREVDEPEPMHMGDCIATYTRSWSWSDDESEQVWVTEKKQGAPRL